MSEENIEKITKIDSNFALTFVDHYVLSDINFNGHYLINNTSISKNVINLYISNILNPCLRDLNTDLILKNCLFGSVELKRNVDPDKYKDSGYDLKFDSRSVFSFIDESMVKNVIILRADMSSSVHIDNKNREILVNDQHNY